MTEIEPVCRLIANTREPMRYPWPASCFVQGGGSGIVLGRSGTRRTAFVEAFPAGTFLRGEGATVAAAEDACWAKYQAMVSCPHDQGFDRLSQDNGSGFCRGCGTWFSRDVTGLDPLPSYQDQREDGTWLGRALAGDKSALTVLEEILGALTDPEEG